MKVTLIPERAYTVKTNDGELKNMRVISEWEGFTKLQAKEGDVMIVESPADGFSSAFRRLFENEHGEVVSVVKASPSLIAVLVPKREESQA
jgi:hypothetical protein